MSTPMFVREPIAGNNAQATNAVVGQALATPFAAPNCVLVQQVTEATLVEEVLFAMRTVNTDAGLLFLYVDYTDTNDALLGEHLVAVYDVDAGTATKPATGRIAVNITLPVGARLEATHNVRENGAGALAYMSILAFGGVAR
jgi:hypothetical protein